MANYFTSDLHFYHRRILDFCPATRSKYGNTVEEMNSNMVLEWNSIVTPSDTVYILGDICFSGITKAVELISQLNGNLVLIFGNHDHELAKKEKFLSLFQKTAWYLRIKFFDTCAILSHFPIMEWDFCNRGSFMLHGHLHGKGYSICSEINKYRILDVGLDNTGKLLISDDEIYKLLKPKPFLQHH